MSQTRAIWTELSPSAVAAACTRVVREDRYLAALVAAISCAQLLLTGWDLPSAIGWENDGVAPRDFLRGVFNNLAPGQGHRYPLFHNLLLFVLCLPILLIAVLAGPLAREPLVARVTSVFAMTGLSLVIKLAHVLMGAWLVVIVARIARRLFGLNAGRGTALCLLTCLTVNYYTRTSNLDGPYMFWTALAVDRLLSVAERGAIKDYALLGLFAAVSIASKDQAYAAYGLTWLLFLLILPRLLPTLLAAGNLHFAHLRFTIGWAVASYLLLAGVVLNPKGFLTRLHMLTGPNSREWRSYARTPQGVTLNLQDLWFAQGTFLWHWGVVGLCWAGIALAIFSSRPEPYAFGVRAEPRASLATQRARALRLLPFISALSSLLLFTLPVARCEHRFILPSAVWLSVYGGFALAWLAERGRLAWLPLALCAAALLASAGRCVELALTQLGDARHGVEAALANLPRESLVETYGFLVHKPRFDLSPDAPYRVQRVGSEPENKRATLAGMREIKAPFMQVLERSPDVILIDEGLASYYFDRTFRAGEAPSTQWLTRRADADALSYFQAATADRLPGYRVARVFEPELPAWAVALGAQPRAIHDLSTGQRVWLLMRRSETAAASVGGATKIF